LEDAENLMDSIQNLKRFINSETYEPLNDRDHAIDLWIDILNKLEKICKECQNGDLLRTF